MFWLNHCEMLDDLIFECPEICFVMSLEQYHAVLDTIQCLKTFSVPNTADMDTLLDLNIRDKPFILYSVHLFEVLLFLPPNCCLHLFW
jgi:hypothetical protein